MAPAPSRNLLMAPATIKAQTHALLKSFVAAAGLALVTFGVIVAEPTDKPIKQLRVDAAGDPLPEGARLRLGNLRFRTAGVVKAVAYAPDGRILAVAGTDRLIRLWDAESGKELRTLSGHEDAVTSIAFSAEGKTL